MLHRISLTALTIFSGVLLTACIPANVPGLGQSQEATGDNIVGQSRIYAALQAGNDISCTIRSEDGDAEFKSSGKKQFISSVDPELNETANILTDGEFTYIWSSGEETGIKMPVVEYETEGSDTDSDSDNDPFNLSDLTEEEIEEMEKVKEQISCTFESLPDSTFQPPTTVRFMELTF